MYKSVIMGALIKLKVFNKGEVSGNIYYYYRKENINKMDGDASTQDNKPPLECNIRKIMGRSLYLRE